MFPLKFEKIIFDPVHGYIGLTEEERKIVDTVIFQRLHNIRQLGTAFFVYPGATHSRFAHSLGTMYVMNKLAERLAELEIIEKEEDLKKLRLAALLHDVGHFPFSHALESNMGKDHEQLSVHLVKNSCIKDCFDTHTPDEISALITKGHVKKTVFSLLISSDLDVDRIDYLLRDSHETGVTYGYIDVERLIRTIVLDKDQHLAIQEKGRQALENFLISRYHMYQTVYYHKTVVSFGLILQRIVNKLLETGKIMTFDQVCKLSDQEFFDFNDNYIWNKLRENQSLANPTGELILMFKNRLRLKLTMEVQGISVSGNRKEEYSNLSLIELDHHLEGVHEKSHVPKDWIFYSQPKPLQILSKAEDETAIRIIKNGESIPIAQDTQSIISVFYDSCFLSSRLYTKEEYEKDLRQGVNDWLKV